MVLFLSTFENKIDAKGRVSVPAPFRSALNSQHFPGVVAYPSFINPCVEACGIERIERLSDSIDALDPFSEERDAFAVSILGNCSQLQFDGDGRVLLPEKLLSVAELKDKAIFVGKGKTFEIWSPRNFQNFAAKAQTLAKEKRALLQLSHKADGVKA